MRQQRIVVVFVLLMLGFGAVIVRLGRLQIVEADMWRRESHISTVRVQAIPFERGWITDRNGVPLATTEEVRDLVFTYRDWRRGSVVGQIVHAAWTLGDPLSGMADVYPDVPARLAALGALRMEDIAALEPRQRRRDLLYYLTSLFGESVGEAAEARLRDDLLGNALRLDELPHWTHGLEAALQRGAAEDAALADLAGSAGLSVAALLGAMEDGMRRSHERVRRALELETAAVRDAAAATAPVDDGLLLRRGARTALLATRALAPSAAGSSTKGSASPPLPSRVDEDPREAYRRLQQLHVEVDSEPVLVASRVPYDVQTLVAIRRRELPGFVIEVAERRVYPPEVQDIAPLIVGRVGAPSPEDTDEASLHRLQLANLSSLTDLTAEELDAYETLRVLVREVDYSLSEERGTLGVESALEELLRGKRGWVATSFAVDSTDVERVEPQRGLNVTLSIDVDLQQACQEVLDAVWEDAPVPDGAPADVPPRWSGAIVLLDAVTGAVRALASGPRPTRAQLDGELGWLYDRDPERRIMHRAVRPGHTLNLPPPGSTFKPVSALAGLVSGMVGPTTQLVCEQRLRVGTREDDVMGCLGRHGPIDVVNAMAKSCNVYFYHLGAKVGGERLREMAERFGFGRTAPLLFGNESLRAMGVLVGNGFLENDPRLGPGPDSRTAAMRLAIGQAPLDDVTPLQVACMMAAVGTGALPAPSLIASIERLGPVAQAVPRSLGVPAGNLDTVRRALQAVVDGGTAKTLWTTHEDIAPHVAGKTGTAQVSNSRDHSWFAGYLPRTAPRLAFAVLIEDVHLHGNEAALPVFELLLAKPAVRAYLAREVLPPGALRDGEP